MQREREEEQKKRQKEEEERKRKREEAKLRRDIMEAAFDGEVDKIKEIMGKVNIWLMLSHIFRVDFFTWIIWIILKTFARLNNGC